MSKIGFLREDGEGRETFPIKNRSDQPMLTFDSGASITLSDARTHTGVFGATGAGKTKSAVLPICKGLINAGLPGFIIDVKGNFRERVRELAAEAGRAADIVEYGSAPAARPVNLLKGLNEYECYEFFQALEQGSYNNQSQNMDFHVKGIKQAADCARLLGMLEKTGMAGLEPRIDLVAEMLADPIRASDLFKFFLASHHDRNKEDEIKFIADIKSNRFHVLNQDPPRSKYEKKDTTKEEQMNYALQGMRLALSTFLETPGIKEKFSGSGAPELNMEKELLAGHIVLLRFDVATGQVGARLARAMITAFYKAVYNCGLGMENGSFVVIDEFQEMADLSQGRFSDRNFVSQAREFGCRFVCCTQSMSAIADGPWSDAAVENFVSNLNNVIFMYTGDVWTNGQARKFDSNADLTQLKRGETYAKLFDSGHMRHSMSRETLDCAYKSINEKGGDNCAAGEFASAKEDLRAKADSAPSLFGITKLIATNRDQDEIDKALSDFFKPKRKSEEAESTSDGDEGQIKRRPTVDRRSKHVPRPDFADDGLRETHPLIEEFPDLIDEDASISIPCGWLEYARSVLRFYRSLVMGGDKVHTMAVNQAFQLHVLARRADMPLLDRLLAGTDRICMKCGAAIENLPASEETDIYGDKRAPLPVCEACLQKHFPGAGKPR